MASIPSAGAAQPVATVSTTSPAAVAGQQRAALVAQLAAATNGSDPQLVALEQQLGTAEDQCAATRHQLDATNARLMDLAQQITKSQHTLAAGKKSLAKLLRSSYVLAGGNDFADYVLSGSDFPQVLDRITGAQHLNDDLSNTLQQLHDAQAALSVEQAQLQQDRASSQEAENTLNARTNWLLAVIATRDAALANSSAEIRGLIAQLDGVDQQQAALVAPHAPVNSSGPCGNHFAFGQCTWYVASRRCVPWFGNAYQWYGAARAYGYAEGSAPAAGAVVVWFPGGGGASGVGHVGYVEAVGPAGGVPAGSFRLSEMNFSAGFDRVDSRTLPNNSPGIAGFIY